MSFKKIDEVIDAPLPLPDKITEETKRVSGTKIRSPFDGSLREFITDEEYEKKRKEILEKELP